MYASIRRYRVNPEQLWELMRRVDEEFAPLVEELDGFMSYQAIECERGTVLSITICRDQETVERSAEIAAEWMRTELNDLALARVESLAGEVGVGRAEAAILEPAHAPR